MTSLAAQTVRLPGDGLEMAGDAYGPDNGPPVLFFHGGGQSRRAWRGTAQRIAKAGYRAITFDLRGHGDSGWAPDGDYLLEAFGRDVEQLIKAFDRPVAVVGASRGGQAALVGASYCPGRVSLVMLADAAPLVDRTGVDKIRGFFKASREGFANVEEAAEALAKELHQPRIPSAAGLTKAMRVGDNGRLYWHWDPRTVAPEFINPQSENDALAAAAARVKDPVVLVHAEFSDIVSAESVKLFRELTPQLEVVEAKGVGHMFIGDKNDAFGVTLLEHLQRLAPIEG